VLSKDEFCEVIAARLGLERRVTPETTVGDLGLDDLQRFALATVLADQGAVLSVADLNDIESIDDAYFYLIQRGQ